MASPTPSASNSLTIPFPLLAVMLAAFLAVAGWGASIRNDVADTKRETAELKSWKEAHEKKAAEQYAALLDATAKSNAAQADNYARLTAQNALLQETITGVRIELARRR